MSVYVCVCVCMCIYIYIYKYMLTPPPFNDPPELAFRKQWITGGGQHAKTLAGIKVPQHSQNLSS